MCRKRLDSLFMLITNHLTYPAYSIALGFIYALLLEQYNYLSYVVIIAISFLFYLWGKASSYQALVSGLVFGLTLPLYSLRWMFVIKEHFGVADWVANIFVVLILLAIAITFALCALFGSLIVKHKTSNSMLVVGLASSWFLAEWLRTWIFTGFPYLQTGYIFIDTPLAGLMPVIGSLGVSFVIAICSALTLLVTTYIKNKKLVIVAVLSMVAIFSVGHILKTIEFTTTLNSKNVRVVNGSISKKDKQKPNIVDKVVDEYIAISNENPLPDLVIWPESSIPDSFHLMYRTKLHQEFIKLKDKGIDVILGAHLTQMSDGINRYNVLLVGGDIQNKYYKRHRVPFGEYMPKAFSPLFPPDLLEDIAETNIKQNPVVLGNMIISPNICFEIMFPELIMKDTNIIINSSDLSWFNDNSFIKKMNLISRIRAVESGKYLLRSDNHGNSLVINHKGDITSQTKDKGYIDATVQLRAGNTPYTILGNFPILTISIVALLLLWMRMFCIVRRE